MMHRNTGVIQRSRQWRSKQAWAWPSVEGTERSLLELDRVPVATDPELELAALAVVALVDRLAVEADAAALAGGGGEAGVPIMG